jgi:hypothetical protein
MPLMPEENANEWGIVDLTQVQTDGDSEANSENESEVTFGEKDAEDDDFDENKGEQECD